MIRVPTGGSFPRQRVSQSARRTPAPSASQTRHGLSAAIRNSPLDGGVRSSPRICGHLQLPSSTWVGYFMQAYNRMLSWVACNDPVNLRLWCWVYSMHSKEWFCINLRATPGFQLPLLLRQSHITMYGYRLHVLHMHSDSRTVDVILDSGVDPYHESWVLIAKLIWGLAGVCNEQRRALTKLKNLQADCWKQERYIAIQ
jgi:hypothetical protein